MAIIDVKHNNVLKTLTDLTSQVLGAVFIPNQPVDFGYASVAYQASLFEPWFIFW